MLYYLSILAVVRVKRTVPEGVGAFLLREMPYDLKKK